jgi:hypothetical protein
MTASPMEFTADLKSTAYTVYCIKNIIFMTLNTCTNSRIGLVNYIQQMSKKKVIVVPTKLKTGQVPVVDGLPTRQLN